MLDAQKFALSKVPQVTLGFWVIKILATTLGETGGDAVTMSMKLGYAVGTILFAGVFILAVAAQIRAKAFHPTLYWVTIIATTTVGTTMADFADRSMGIGYAGGSTILFLALIASLAFWRWSEGSVAVNTVATPRVEVFYWVTILFSQTLGTALGDWMAGEDSGGLGLGYEYGSMIFGAGLAVVAAAYVFTNMSRVLLFWIAFILTRPLGATLGDLLDKPLANGGMAISRYYASALLLALMVALIFLLPQKAGARSETRVQSATP